MEDEDTDTSSDDSDSNEHDGDEQNTDSDDLDHINSIHPLDLKKIVMMCADDFLKQEINGQNDQVSVCCSSHITYVAGFKVSLLGSALGFEEYSKKLLQ